MTSKEYEYIIEQQKQLIEQQREFYENVIEQQMELIKSLTVHNKVFLQKDGTDKIEPYYPVPPVITCSDMPYCTEAPIDKNKCYTSYYTISTSNYDGEPLVIDMEGKEPDEFNIYEAK